MAFNKIAWFYPLVPLLGGGTSPCKVLEAKNKYNLEREAKKIASFKLVLTSLKDGTGVVVNQSCSISFRSLLLKLSLTLTYNRRNKQSLLEKQKQKERRDTKKRRKRKTKRGRRRKVNTTTIITPPPRRSRASKTGPSTFPPKNTNTNIRNDPETGTAKAAKKLSARQTPCPE